MKAETERDKSKRGKWTDSSERHPEAHSKTARGGQGKKEKTHGHAEKRTDGSGGKEGGRDVPLTFLSYSHLSRIRREAASLFNGSAGFGYVSSCGRKTSKTFTRPARPRRFSAQTNQNRRRRARQTKRDRARARRMIHRPLLLHELSANPREHTPHVGWYPRLPRRKTKITRHAPSTSHRHHPHQRHLDNHTSTKQKRPAPLRTRLYPHTCIYLHLSAYLSIYRYLCVRLSGRKKKRFCRARGLEE